MATAPKSGGNNFAKHPEGAFAVRLAQIIDTGSHFVPDKVAPVRKIRLMFISTALIPDGELEGQPFALFNNFNFSMFKNSHLCKFVEQWRGKAFADQPEADAYDLDALLNQAVYAQVAHNGEWVNIMSAMPLPQGMAAPAIPEKTNVLSFYCHEPNMANLEKLNDKTREKIMASNEMKNQGQAAAPQQAPAAPPANQPSPPPVEAGDNFQDSVLPF